MYKYMGGRSARFNTFHLIMCTTASVRRKQVSLILTLHLSYRGCAVVLPPHSDAVFICSHDVQVVKGPIDRQFFFL